MKTIELTDEEIELIDDALTSYFQETMNWVDAEAKKYIGYSSDCKEVEHLTDTAVKHYNVGELMSRFDDYLKEIKGESILEKL